MVLCASNYQCVGVLSENLGVWFLLFSCVCCGLHFKWDTNVIYSAWHDAVRENWSFPGNANMSKEKGCTWTARPPRWRRNAPLKLMGMEETKQDVRSWLLKKTKPKKRAKCQWLTSAASKNSPHWKAELWEIKDSSLSGESCRSAKSTTTARKAPYAHQQGMHHHTMGCLLASPALSSTAQSNPARKFSRGLVLPL